MNESPLRPEALPDDTAVAVPLPEPETGVTLLGTLRARIEDATADIVMDSTGTVVAQQYTIVW